MVYRDKVRTAPEPGHVLVAPAGRRGQDPYEHPVPGRGAGLVAPAGGAVRAGTARARYGAPPG